MTNDPLLAHRTSPNDARQMISGFQVWNPPERMESTFEIIGSEFSQVLEIAVGPDEVITAEPGTMLYMSPGMGLDADIGGCGQGCKRCCCAGESMFRLHLQNTQQSTEKVAVTPKFPAKIVPVDLRHHDGLIFNRGAFLAAIGKSWRVDIRSVASAGVCCFGGQGLFLNTLHGDGMVFLNAGGTVLTKVLQAGEEMIIDKHGLLAFERTVTMDIRRTGGCMVCCCAGQGLFNSVLRGPGFVMVHSMSLGRLRSAIGGAGGDGANKGGQA
jgi:uncharacterized protein (AIM24 family)